MKGGIWFLGLILRKGEGRLLKVYEVGGGGEGLAGDRGGVVDGVGKSISELIEQGPVG